MPDTYHTWVSVEDNVNWHDGLAMTKNTKQFLEIRISKILRVI
jgi:hypothetical protein